MNLTLGNLATLKAWLLPASEVSGTEWDSAIAALGKGAAAALERHCHRKFVRTVADTFECSADRAHVVLPRYPVETVTSIEIRRSLTEGWVALTDVIENQNLAAGLLLFGSEPGSWSERLRITFTGGLWFDDKEPADAGYPTAQPAGSTAVPADLQLAWMQQCAHLWRQKDKLGSALASNNGEAVASRLELQDGVKEAVAHYRRLTLS